MTTALLSLLTGTVLGWIGSLVMRTDTQAGILTDIGIGAFSGLVAALALTSDYALDAFLAAALGAMVILSMVAFASVQLAPERRLEQKGHAERVPVKRRRRPCR
jgi:uncharacterized membrane protein YeaQ/YmgE (transglycosylase-associated protein family)